MTARSSIVSARKLSSREAARGVSEGFNTKTRIGISNQGTPWPETSSIRRGSRDGMFVAYHR